MVWESTANHDGKLSSFSFDDGEFIIFDPKNTEAWIQSDMGVDLSGHA